VLSTAGCCLAASGTCWGHGARTQPFRRFGDERATATATDYCTAVPRLGQLADGHRTFQRRECSCGCSCLRCVSTEMHVMQVNRLLCETATEPLTAVLSLPGVQLALPTHQSKSPGQCLPPDHTIRVDVDEHDASPQQLEVQPITMYNTEASMELRRFVTASASYICYGLKAGQLRVLHRATAARALLRGHTAPVTDLRRVWQRQSHEHCSWIFKRKRCVLPACVLSAASSLGWRQLWLAQQRTGSSLFGASARVVTVC
jgi:hypothetical protein